MSVNLFNAIALIGQKKTIGSDKKRCLKAFNINNLLSLLFCISLLTIYIYRGVEAFLINITIITIIYSPIIFFFSILGYKKLLVIFYIVWRLIFISEIHISLYKEEIVSLPTLLLAFCLPIQAFNTYATKRRIHKYFVLIAVLILVISFILYKMDSVHLAKILLKNDVMVVEWCILAFATLFLTINMLIILNNYLGINTTIENVYNYWQKKNEKMNAVITSYNKSIDDCNLKGYKLMEVRRLESIKNKILNSYESSLIKNVSIDYDLICSYIMSIFNSKHIAIYIKKGEFLQPLSIYINRIKKNVDDVDGLTREYKSLQNIFKIKKVQLLKNLTSEVFQSGISEDLKIDKMLYLNIKNKNNEYYLVCNTPNLETLNDYYKSFKETIDDIFSKLEIYNRILKSKKRVQIQS